MASPAAAVARCLTVIEIVHRFGQLAIDELNGHRSARCEAPRNFLLLMIGLIAFLGLLFAQIIT
jgi:hypothetical protein